MNDSVLSGQTSRPEAERERSPARAAPRPDAAAPSAAPLAAFGNQAAQHLLAAGRLHPKLAVGSAGDPVERDADAMAAAALGARKPCGCLPGAPRCASCRAASGQVHRQARSAATPAGVEHLPLGPSRPLPAAERSFFESRYGTDLSAVRLHDNDESAASAARIDARAFALGPHIGFGHGQYRPHTASGRLLLAHELAHVAQESDGATIRRDTRAERAAEVERSRLSPGGLAAHYPPLRFSLYNFAIEEAALKEEHYEFLEELAAWLRGIPGATVSVSGHADSTGTPAINVPLSENRAAAVSGFLGASGLATGAPQGFAATVPAADNASERGRSRNRRVDISVTLPTPIPIPEEIEEPEPEEPEPPEPPDGWVWPEFELPCTTYPVICGLLGPVIFCVLFPEVCALPGFCVAFPSLCKLPDWPDGDGDGEEPPEEPEEEPPQCGDPRLPLTVYDPRPPGGDKGNIVVAEPLTRCPGNSRGSPAKRDDRTWPHGWICVDGAEQSHMWSRSHLLHHGLHGPGNDRRNIIITDKSINGLMRTRVEGDAINRTRLNRVLWYEVEVSHFTGPYPRPYFGESVHMAWGEMDPLTGLHTSTEFDDDIQSNYGHQPPPCASEVEPPEETPVEPDLTPPVPEGPAPQAPEPAEPQTVDGCPVYPGFDFDFAILARLPRSRRFHVPGGASVTVESLAEYVDDVEAMPVRPGMRYYIMLHRLVPVTFRLDVTAPPFSGGIVYRTEYDVDLTAVLYEVGQAQTHTWGELEDGCYYLEIWKDEPGGFSPFELRGTGTVSIGRVA